MLVLAKVALGLGATLAMTTAYIFHEGVIRVDVDEHRPGGRTCTSGCRPRRCPLA